MERDIPHYLKKTKTTKTPKRLAYFYVNGKVTKRGNNNELSWGAGALGTRHTTAKSRTRRDTLQIHETPMSLWRTLDAFCIRGKRVVLWTYDLPEQLRTSHALVHLPELGWSLETVVLEAGASWALWRNGDKSLMMCDLKSWTPYDWERINRDMSSAYDRADAPPHTLSAVEAVAFNKCRVIRAAVGQILDWIEAEQLGMFKPTGSGQSYSAYKRRWLSDRILVHDDIARLEAERRSMFAGRTEAWRHGDMGNGPFLELDMRAAYSRIAAECNVPTVATGDVYQPDVDKLLAASKRHTFLCHVQLETEVPCVPYGTGQHTLWPEGRFDTWLWSPELALANLYCSSVRVTKAYRYRTGPALQAFASHVLGIVDGHSYEHGAMPQLVAKHWSRTLVGRFGLRYRSWIPFADNDMPDLSMVTFIDYDDDTMTDMMCVGKDMLLLGDLTESLESVPQIPAWVMSECRRRLWVTMMEIGLDRILYVDTDSIIIDLKGDLAYGRAIQRRYRGMWAVKGRYASMHIYGPRNLRIDADRRVSGLPAAAIQHGPSEFRGEVMRSIAQSMRSGQLDTVTTVPRTFIYNSVDTRRRHNKDGSTSAFRVGEGVTEENI